MARGEIQNTVTRVYRPPIEMQPQVLLLLQRDTPKSGYQRAGPPWP